MSIERCGLPGGKQGYRWGGTGVCYAERASAERQAAAAYANGYQGDGASSAAGVLLHRDGQVFLGQRAHDGTWAMLGGMMEENEDALTAAAREFQKESGVAIDAASLVPLHVNLYDTGEPDFVSWLAPSYDGDDAFTMCDEHSASGWFPLNNLPAPLHPGVREAIAAMGSAIASSDEALAADGLAMDRMTVRSLDAFGRMHVELANITKANVCPYRGREIPNYERHGLDPNKVYMLYRDPVELAKAAPTFARLPLLFKHIRHSSSEPVKFAVVGTTGSDPMFVPPYLQVDLAVWDDEAIAGIETGDQKELSSSYKYEVDMTPGEADGVPYDGRMVDIAGNHVALVFVGRAGADVVVGDSYPVELLNMKKANRHALAMRSALGAHLRPALAQDEAPLNLRDLIKPGMKPADIAKATKKHYKGKFEVNEADTTAILQLAMDEADKEDDTADDEDETEEEKEARLKKEKDAKDADPDAPEGGKKPSEAMDAATVEQMVKRAREDATRQAREEAAQLRTASAAVRPLVGELAMDSAEDTYRAALESIGVDTKGIHVSALPAMVEMAKSNRAVKTPTTLAMDAADSRESFRKAFPNAVTPKRA